LLPDVCPGGRAPECSARSSDAAPAYRKLVLGVARQACTENLQYRASGISTSASGIEQTQSRCEISLMPSLLGFYGIAETVTESNGQPDCAGEVHEATNEPVIRFIQFSPQQDLLIV